jgi:hypothetical protein
VVSEWSKERDWKSRIRQRIVGSNPTRSATFFKVESGKVEKSDEPVSGALKGRNMGRSEFTASEVDRQGEVLELIRQFVKEGKTIPLDREKGSFGGFAGDYRYLFEGEDDLLHLIVERRDGQSLELEETNAVARFLLPDVPEAMVWLRPGSKAHHYYLGHDLLL